MNHSISLPWEESTLMLRAALRSTVVRNAASLYVIQFANYILPLITIPYLVRVLGPAGFGAVAFGQSLIGYFMLFVDYGFNLSATRKISINRNDPVAVSRTVFNTWGVKFLLCGVSFAVLVLLISIVPKLREVSALLLVLYDMVIGNVLFPTWLFQGMERMVAISVINLLMKLLVVLGIFTLVRLPEHYIVYAGLMSAGWIAAGITGMGVAFYMFKLRPVPPSWRGIWEALVEGWMLFLSMALVSLYTVGNAFILGMLTNHTVVGYYSVAEKIVKAVVGLLGPISQAVYPRFSKLASESKANALLMGRKILFLMSGLGACLFIVLFAGAPIIVRILLEPGYEPSIAVMRILSALPLLIGASNVLGIQLMLPFGKDRAFTLILFSAGLINIGLAVLLAPIWQQTGMAVAIFITELFVTTTMLVYLFLRQLSPLKISLANECANIEKQIKV